MEYLSYGNGRTKWYQEKKYTKQKYFKRNKSIYDESIRIIDTNLRHNQPVKFPRYFPHGYCFRTMELFESSRSDAFPPFRVLSSELQALNFPGGWFLPLRDPATAVRLLHPVICATWRTLRTVREPRVVTLYTVA